MGRGRVAMSISYLWSRKGLCLLKTDWPLRFLLGIVAFRQHLQNLARTKGILELNKVQLLYEQMGPEADPNLASAAPQLQDLASSCPQVSALGPSHGGSVSMSLELVLKMCHFI